jgi:hypothetical protein
MPDIGDEESTSRDAATEDIMLRVACLDGSCLDLTVPPQELVRKLKQAIGQVRGERDVACR